MEELSQLLLQIQSSDNSVRASAEARLYSQWLDAEAGPERPSLLLVTLAELSTNGEPSLRGFAAVIFRKCSTRLGTGGTEHFPSVDTPHLTRVFDQLSPAAQDSVRSTLVQGLLSEAQPAFARRKIGDAIAELARPAGVWPQLWPVIAEAATSSPNADVREACFRVLCGAPEILPNDLQAVTTLLSHGFNDPSEAVRTTSTTAFAAFFAYLPRNTWAHFKPLLPSLLNVMEPLRQQHQEEELTSVLESLVTLTEIAPKMFLPVFPTLIQFSLAVAGERDLDEAPRMTALELVAAFADSAPNMCTREPTYISSVVPMLLKLLTEVGIDDDFAAEWQETDDNDTIEEEESVHREAKLAIDRLSLSLGGNVVAPVLFEYLPAMLSSTDWRERLAGLMALSNAAEGCRDEMLPNLEQILQAVVPMLNDEHPRVQWSACNALGQLSTDLAPELQENFGGLVLPGLISKLSGSTFKVQAHAAAALVNFSESATKEIMDPYLDDLLSQLLGLVQSPKRYVQEQALTTIAMVADSSQQLFVKYYDTLMPLVLNILEAPLPAEYRLLKAKAIECATLIALAVGRDVFAPHMQQLGQLLLQIQEQSNEGFVRNAEGDEEEDPCSAYLVQSWGRLCRVVGPDFAPFLPVVMPPLLTAAKAKADCHVLDVEQAESLRDTEGWDVVKYAGQWLGIHTAWFDEKASAIELLHVYPRELGASFWPYVTEIVNDIVLPGIKFYYNLRARTYSCQLAPHLIYVALQHSEADALALWRPILDTMNRGVLRNKSEIPGMHAEVFLSIYRVVEILGTKALTVDDINLLFTSMSLIVQAAYLRLEEREAEQGPKTSAGAGGHAAAASHNATGESDDEYEEFDEDEDDDEEREDEELIDASNRLIHSLLRTYGADLLKTKFSDLCSLIPHFATSKSQDCRLWALEVIGDLVEFGKEQATQALEAGGLTQIPLQGLQPTAQNSPLVRAGSALCIGRIALYGGATLSKLSLEALEPLFALALAADANSSENVETKERCCGAIARILRTFGPSALSPEQFSLAIGEWIKTLPITQEGDGASYSYLLLAELIEKKHPAVVQNYQTVFYVIVAALQAHTLAGKPAEYVVAQTKQLISSLPDDKRVVLLNGLSKEQQQIVHASFN